MSRSSWIPSPGDWVVLEGAAFAAHNGALARIVAGPHSGPYPWHTRVALVSGEDPGDWFPVDLDEIRPATPAELASLELDQCDSAL